MSGEPGAAVGWPGNMPGVTSIEVWPCSEVMPVAASGVVAAIAAGAVIIIGAARAAAATVELEAAAGIVISAGVNNGLKPAALCDKIEPAR